MRTSSTFFILFFTFTILSSQPLLVKNIYPGPGNAIKNNVVYASLPVGDILYFAANDSLHGEELWKTNGTEAGTVLVRNLHPTDSIDGVDAILFSHDDYLFFMGRDPIRKLFRSDGTEAGTLPFRDICATNFTQSSLVDEPSDFTVLDGKLYFPAWPPAPNDFMGTELMRSDGTPGGTMVVKDLHPTGIGNPATMAAFAGKLYFSATDASLGRELWVSDGTEAGTFLLKDINTGAANADPSPLLVGDDKFYFSAVTAAQGRELWVSDGTADGTTLVKNIGAGTGDGLAWWDYDISAKAMFTDAGDLLFVASDNTNGSELWKTDGTEAGTFLVKNIEPGSFGSSIHFLGRLGDRILFRALSGNTGMELWATDGTPAGTQLVKELFPGNGHGVSAATVLTAGVYQGKMYFSGRDASTAYEPWVTDGTPEGTYMLYDLNPGSLGSSPSDFHVIGNTLFFFANTAATGRELWKYDLTSVGTNEPGQTLSLKIFPTVSADGLFSLQIDGEPAEVYRVEVFDVLGRLQASQRLPEGSRNLDLSALPNGAWFVRLSGEETRKTGIRRVVVMR